MKCKIILTLKYDEDEGVKPTAHGEGQFVENSDGTVSITSLDWEFLGDVRTSKILSITIVKP